MGEVSSNWTKHRANFAQDGERYFTIENVQVKKLTGNAALLAHILYNETRIYSNICW